MDFSIKNNRESQNIFFNQKVVLINFGKQNHKKYMENLENYGGALLRAAAGAFFSKKNTF